MFGRRSHIVNWSPSPLAWRSQLWRLAAAVLRESRAPLALCRVWKGGHWFGLIILHRPYSGLVRSAFMCPCVSVHVCIYPWICVCEHQSPRLMTCLERKHILDFILGLTTKLRDVLDFWWEAESVCEEVKEQTEETKEVVSVNNKA